MHGAATAQHRLTAWCPCIRGCVWWSEVPRWIPNKAGTTAGEKMISASFLAVQKSRLTVGDGEAAASEVSTEMLCRRLASPQPKGLSHHQRSTWFKEQKITGLNPLDWINLAREVFLKKKKIDSPKKTHCCHFLITQVP